ncbi:hypothetical protein BKA65DRAFT_544533 [Rhexocercosporidium sp. MPI-PUGE-AT-0058]|nr:hypothetical protein BKA65DRAFT_544533 [Rhexocercosporidium sp. MPI-PUGE-AT-0058]
MWDVAQAVATQNAGRQHQPQLQLCPTTNAVVQFKAATVAWCNEIANYHGKPVDEGDFEPHGHHVLWPNSTSVGLGVAQGSSGAFYVCGRYSPAGNVVGVSAWGANGSPNPCHKQQTILMVSTS